MKIIELENIGKKYILKQEKGAFIKDVLPRLFIPKEEKEFWALKDINLEVEKGECLGILGRNGAGKSTLLNLIAGISSPTEGNIKVKGKLSTLLTLGAGFHPELSGIDNIYLNGVILGLKISEIKERLKEIIEFADLHDFINQPLYTYSSGMVLRLGFSIAVHINFDILLIDEILSVGDISFQEKCIERINSFKEEGKTLIIASQSLELMKTLCHRAVLLENGKILSSGEPEKVIDKYLEVIQEKCMVEKRISQYPVLPRYPEDIERIESGWGSCLGSGEAKILEVKLKGKNGEEKRVFKNGETLIVDVKYKVEKEINYPHFGVAIFREDYIYCYGPNTDFDKIIIKRLNKGIGSFSIEYKKLILGAGDYRLSVALWDKEEKSPYDYHYAYYKFSIGERRRGPSPLIDIPCFLFFNGAWREKLLCPSFDKNQVRRDNFMEIEKVISKGRWGREKNTFSTNELLRLLLEIKILDRIDSPFVYFLIENENMLIQEACFEIGDYLKPGIIKMFLYYPKVPLLRGDYFLALGIGSKKEGKIFQYFPKLINWEFKTAKKDHGIVYLEHRWKLNNP